MKKRKKKVSGVGTLIGSWLWKHGGHFLMIKNKNKISEENKSKTTTTQKQQQQQQQKQQKVIRFFCAMFECSV